MESDEVVAALRRLDLVGADEAVHLTPLAGGVSSDICLVETASRRFCVKRALARLKVAALWEAPLERNAAEAAWIRTVGKWLPNAAPQILGEDSRLGLFAMTYLPPQDYPVWKAELLQGAVDMDFAEMVGRELALIHARSAADSALPLAFANDATFEQIRLEPYLRATARAHPDLAARLNRLADRTLAEKRALVHGDVSPKNMLHGAAGPVFLDAECAWFGEPAFDLAFCLNHLLLKGARHGVSRAPFCEAFGRLSQAYRNGVAWEAPEAVEARAAALLPALLLARIDGKSPVEYLTRDDEKDAIRRFARPLIVEPIGRLSAIVDLWSAAQ
ncbi:MAG: aminoglycoside phosphotransferase family protein [Roseiarcus sp.]